MKIKKYSFNMLIILVSFTLGITISYAHANVIEHENEGKVVCTPDETIFNPQWRTLKCQTCQFTIGKPVPHASFSQCSPS